MNRKKTLRVRLAMGAAAGLIGACGTVPEDTGSQASVTICEARLTAERLAPLESGPNGSRRCYETGHSSTGFGRTRSTLLGFAIPPDSRIEWVEVFGEIDTNIAYREGTIEVFLTSGRRAATNDPFPAVRTRADEAGRFHFAIGDTPATWDVRGLDASIVNSRNFGFDVQLHATEPNQCSGHRTEPVESLGTVARRKCDHRGNRHHRQHRTDDEKRHRRIDRPTLGIGGNEDDGASMICGCTIPTKG